MRPPWSYVPALPLLIAIVCGIVLSKYITESDILIIVALVCLVSSCLIFKLRYYAVLTLAVAVGYTAEYLTEYNLRASVPDDDASYAVVGEVISVGESDMSQRLVLKLREPYSGVCYVMVPDYDDIREYDVVCFRGQFAQLPVSSAYDDVNLEEFYYRRGITCYCKAYNGSLKVVGHATGVRPLLSEYRERLVDVVLNSELSPSTQSFVIALILGDDTYLEHTKRDEFASAGIAHILALSGMHVAIIVMILSFMFLPLRLFGYRKLSYALIVVMLWGYAVMTGLSPSVMRATIMFSLILLARCMGRYNSMCNSLIVAAIIILVCSPRELFTPGFQLSFVAVSGLVVLPTLVKCDCSSAVKRWLVNYALVTIAAVCSTVFLVTYYFHQVPLLFIVTNLLCSALLPLIMIIGVIVMILGAFGVENGLLDRLLDIICGAIEQVAHYISGIEISAIDDIYISWWQVLLAYALVGLMVIAVYYKNKRVMTLTSVLIVITSMLFLRSDNVDVLMVKSYSNGTQILYTDNHKGYVITTEMGNAQSYIEDVVYSRHHGLWARHGIKSVKNITPSSDGGGASSAIKFYDYRLLLVNGNVELRDSTHYHYIIVGSGFKGDIVELGLRSVCDSILLGYDIRMPRRQRYENELIEAGMPVRVLSQFSGLTLESRDRP